MKSVAIWLLSAAVGGLTLACGHAAPDGTIERTASTQEKTSILTGYDLENATGSADPGTSVSVDWTAPTGHSTNDWIGLYAVGDPDSSPSASYYPLGNAGVGSGTISLTLPSNASGSWEFRYFEDASLTEAAVSNSISVNAVTYTVSGDDYAIVGTAVDGNWTAPASHSTNDWIGLYQTGAPNSATLASLYPLGNGGNTSGSFMLVMPSNAAAGSYEFRYFLNNEYTLAATSAPIGVYTVSGPANADPGTAVTANWAGPTSHSTNDWIGLYQVGDPDSSPTASVYPLGASGVGSGSAQLQLPSTATGSWELRYFINASLDKAAVSGPISINTVTYTVTGPSTADPGTDVTANWTAPTSHSPNDWIGLYQVGDPDGSPTASVYPLGGAGVGSGSAQLPLPQTATGSWELRYFLNGGSTKAATSGTITINSVSYTVSGPASVPNGTYFTANWTAPTSHSANDWIGLYRVGDPDTSPTDSAYPIGGAGLGAGSAQLYMAQGATGSWELRYFLDASYTKAATSSTILAQ